MLRSRAERGAKNLCFGSRYPMLRLRSIITMSERNCASAPTLCWSTGASGVLCYIFEHQVPYSFIDFSKESTVLSGGQKWGWGVNFLDVLECVEFKNTNFRVSYTYVQNFLPSTSLGKYGPIHSNFQYVLRNDRNCASKIFMKISWVVSEVSSI